MNYATDKQVSYIESLAKKVYGQRVSSRLLAEIQYLTKNQVYVARNLNRRAASALIDILKSTEPTTEIIDTEKYIKEELDYSDVQETIEDAKNEGWEIDENEMEIIAGRLMTRDIDDIATTEQVVDYVKKIVAASN